MLSISRAMSRCGHGKAALAFVLQQGEDDGVALDEDFLGSIGGEELVHRFEEIQAEERGGFSPRSSMERVRKVESRMSALSTT